ncbi:MAG: SAM-dependent methyltransferase [Anaerolineae bacterium]
MERRITAMDTSIPNAGRVYDYVLGGTHNFEADRQAAEYMISLVPSTRKWVRMLRMFMQESVLRLSEEGFGHFLDLASGLPTVEHIHALAPHAKVIYVDNDPVVVAYGTQLLEGHPNARYLEADIRDIDALLRSPVISEMFGEERKVAIGFNAVTCFLTEEEIRRIARALYEWAAPGSKLFATFETKDPHRTTPKMEQFLAMFDQMGSPYHFLTLEQAMEWMKPWEADERGYRPLAEWLGMPDQITEADREGVGLEFYGAILVKR